MHADAAELILSLENDKNETKDIAVHFVGIYDDDPPTPPAVIRITLSGRLASSLSVTRAIYMFIIFLQTKTHTRALSSERRRVIIRIITTYR